MKQYSIYSFEQLRIIPQVSDVGSRSECRVSAAVGELDFEVPLISASMHALVTQEFVTEMERCGSGVVQPRNTHYLSRLPIYSSSINSARNMAEKLGSNKGVLFVEIAHGGLRQMADVAKSIKSDFPKIIIFGGNVDNVDTAAFLEDSGYDGVLVNVGNGSGCSTTEVTGVGLPLVSSILEIKKSATIPIIACGGVRTVGEFVKCIALGCDLVMSGMLFAQCKETLSGQTGVYYGETSEKNKGGKGRVEGKVVHLGEERTLVSDVLDLAKQSLQSAMSYSNSKNLVEFRDRVRLAYLGNQ